MGRCDRQCRCRAEGGARIFSVGVNQKKKRVVVGGNILYESDSIDGLA